MRQAFLPFAFSLLSFTACAQIAGGQTPVVRTAIGEALDDYLTNQVEGGFSGVVIAAVDGEPVLRKGYGFADRDAGVPNSPATVFQIGSVTKPFTATAILKLLDEGRLSVEDPISDYFEDVPADKRGITLHHLLTHTAGFPGAIGRDYEEIDRHSYIARALATPLKRPPGAGYEYSNVGFALLAAVVEMVAGQSFDAYLKDSVLSPAGIQHTGYRLPDALPQARGYDGQRDLGFPTDRAWAEDGPYWNLRGNGGLLSTADDLYRFHVALEAGSILSDSARALAYSPHTDEGPMSGTYYGYGWALFPAPGGGRLIAHNGGDPGFSSDFLRFLDDDLVLIVLSNDRRVEAFAVSAALTNILFGQTAPPIEAPEERRVDPGELAESVEGQRALGFVEAINAGTDADYRRFIENHLDVRFRANADQLITGFFDAVAEEIGHAPLTLCRAVQSDGHVNLYAILADGRGYWIELGFERTEEGRIAGMQTDYVDPDTARGPDSLECG